MDCPFTIESGERSTCYVNNKNIKTSDILSGSPQSPPHTTNHPAGPVTQNGANGVSHHNDTKQTSFPGQVTGNIEINGHQNGTVLISHLSPICTAIFFYVLQKLKPISIKQNTLSMIY
jgi:hypothetical protein